MAGPTAGSWFSHPSRPWSWDGSCRPAWRRRSCRPGWSCKARIGQVRSRAATDPETWPALCLGESRRSRRSLYRDPSLRTRRLLGLRSAPRWSCMTHRLSDSRWPRNSIRNVAYCSCSSAADGLLVEGLGENPGGRLLAAGLGGAALQSVVGGTASQVAEISMSLAAAHPGS